MPARSAHEKTREYGSSRLTALGGAQKNASEKTVDAEYTAAGFWVRVKGFCIDFVICAVIYLVTNFTVDHSPNVDVGFFLVFLYFVLFTKLNHGQTIGKRFAGTRVVSKDKDPINWLQAVFRFLIFVAVFGGIPAVLEGVIPKTLEETIFYILLFGNSFVVGITKRGVHDYICRTFEIYV